MVQPDDFIKLLQNLKSTFSAARLLHIEEADDIDLYEHIHDDLPMPVLGRHYDEIPLYILILISYLTYKNLLDIRNCTIGLVGINISSLRIVRLLKRL